MSEEKSTVRRRKLKIIGLATVAVLGSCQLFYLYGWSRFHAPTSSTESYDSLDEPPKDTVELDRACMLLDKSFTAASQPDFTRTGVRQWTDCRSIKTIPGWTVEHCATPGSNPRNDIPPKEQNEALSCYPGGFFRIQKLEDSIAGIASPSCQLEANRVLSKDEGTNKYATSFMGPDSFRIVLLGPERLSLMQQQYLGDCTYAIPYLISRPGRFWVQKVLHTYQDFDAMDEGKTAQDHRWPEYLGKNILDPIAERKQQEDDEAKQGPDHATNLEMSHYHFEVCSHCVSFVQMDEDQGLGGTGDICTRSTTMQARQYGIYRAQSTIHSIRQAQSHQYEWIPARPRCRFFPDQTSFEPVNDETDTQDQRKEKEQAAACLQKPRSLYFVGDSHVRQIFFGFMLRLQGQSGAIETQADQTLEVGKIKGMYDLDGFLNETLARIQYSIENVGDSFDLLPGEEVKDPENIANRGILEQIDTVVLGFGSLPASLPYWSTVEFVERIQRVFDGLVKIHQIRSARGGNGNREDPMNTLRVIWTGIPAWTDRTDKTVRDSADVRTNPRILYWNKLVDQIIDGVNGRVGGRGMIDRLDSFEITMPFKNSTMDYLHYVADAPNC
ncbi:hypothetical protein BGZ83_001169 [Gryganskiella cystojenkinii]|nr:hypothetical protein BGZ83_001169 [Gryganskiella cystojenkinii]